MLLSRLGGVDLKIRHISASDLSVLMTSKVLKVSPLLVATRSSVVTCTSATFRLVMGDKLWLEL